LALEELDSSIYPALYERAVYLALKIISIIRKYPTECKKLRLVTAISKRRYFEAVSVLFHNHNTEAIYSTVFQLYKAALSQIRKLQ
jgi:hypothetical protein